MRITTLRRAGWCTVVAVTLLAAASAALAAPTASRGGAAKTVEIKGVQTVIDEKKGLYTVSGSLVGDWAVTAFTPRYQTPTTFAGTGRERFRGCLDVDGNGTCDAAEPSGTMQLVFTYWATFGAKGLVRGACVHPVTGGTGGFANVRGLLVMKDLPTAKGVRTTYTGTLTLGSGRSAAARALAVRRSCGG